MRCGGPSSGPKWRKVRALLALPSLRVEARQSGGTMAVEAQQHAATARHFPRGSETVALARIATHGCRERITQAGERRNESEVARWRCSVRWAAWARRSGTPWRSNVGPLHKSCDAAMAGTGREAGRGARGVRGNAQVSQTSRALRASQSAERRDEQKSTEGTTRRYDVLRRVPHSTAHFWAPPDRLITIDSSASRAHRCRKRTRRGR